MKVLLADDAPESRLIVSMYLRGVAESVVAVGNGQEALERFRSEPFGLVLLDIEMPVMDGLTAARAMRRWEQELGLGRTPIVALSAHTEPEVVAEITGAGCDSLLNKPLDRTAVKALIARWAAVRPAAQG
jgi:CheY-like chemotaxis protein